jgi:hypothetical protein
MNPSARTDLANRALDLIGKHSLLDLDTDTSPTGKMVLRNYSPVLLRCLRKTDWNFATLRVSLNPSTTVPVNQFKYQFELPPDNMKVIRVYPDNTAYKVEGNFVFSNVSPLTIKYVTNASLADPTQMDPSFAEFFVYSLASEICYTGSDNSQRSQELKAGAKERFEEAAALQSQEGTDDEPEQSLWTTGFDSGSDWDPNKVE